MSSTEDLLICTACGTQFDESDPKVLTSCRICDDPRQFVPPTGQSFTTFRDLKASHTTIRTPVPSAPHLTSLTCEPKFGIGQRAILIQTSAGNVLWDCITLLDDETITWINSLGGLVAIAISHPHYYTTHLVWASTFNCPVYVSREDEEWFSRADPGNARSFLEAGVTSVRIAGKNGADTGFQAIKLGGHFPGSLVGLTEGRLLVADTLVTTPAGMGNWKEAPRPQGMNSFAFMWSIPNMIPLAPDVVAQMWTVLKEFEFVSTHGAFVGTEIVSGEVKGRVLESMKIQVRGEGYGDHRLLYEGWSGP